MHRGLTWIQFMEWESQRKGREAENISKCTKGKESTDGKKNLKIVGGKKDRIWLKKYEKVCQK